MSFRRFSLASGLAVALLGPGSLMVSRAPGQSPPQHGQRIEQPAPSKSSAVTTNLNQLGSRRDGLKQLEDQLNWSFNPFKSALEPNLTPQFRPPSVPAPVTQNRKALADEILRRKNWAFTGMEELMLGTSDPAGSSQRQTGAQGRPRNSAHSANSEYGFEHLYGGINPPDRNSLGSSRDDGWPASRARMGQSDEGDVPGSVKDSERELRKLLSSHPNGSLFGSSGARSSFSDFFGLGQQGLSSQQVLEHRAYMDQYRQLLNGLSASSSGSALSQAGAETPAGQPAAVSSGLNSLVGTTRHEEAAPGLVGPLLNPGLIEDPSARLLNQWNPLYTPPKPEPPKPAPLTAPMAEVPRRKF